MVTVPDTQEIKSLLPEVENLKYHEKGGFKIVYVGQVNGKKEAVKLVQIPEDPHDDEVRKENLGRIKREVDLISKCSSPYLVNIGSLEVREFEINGITYFLYSEEFIVGDDLKSKIRDGYKPSQGELKELAKCIISCIEELDSIGAIHRDIKPANILKTDQSDRPFILIDLGLAFLLDGTNLTKRGVPGTRAYLAPEMFESNFRKRLDYRADLYNLGLTIYEYATNNHPFRDKYNHTTTLLNIQNVTPPNLYSIRSDLDKEFCSLIDSWIKKKPMLRNSNFDTIKNILA